MANACAGAHHLDIARFYASDVAEVVLVRHGPPADVRDDFDVPVPMERKSGSRRDLIVIPYDQRTERPVTRVALAPE